MKDRQFYTLTLQLKKKDDKGHYLNGVKYFRDYLYRLKRHSNEDFRHEFKGICWIMDADADYVYYIFIKPAQEHLEPIRSKLIDLLEDACNNSRTNLEYVIDEGEICNDEYKRIQELQSDDI